MNSNAKKAAVDDIAEEKSATDSSPTVMVPTLVPNSPPSTDSSPSSNGPSPPTAEESCASSATAKDKGKGIAEPSRKRKHIITYVPKDGDGKQVLKIKRRRTDEDDNLSKKQLDLIERLAARYELQKKRNLDHLDLLMRSCVEEYYAEIDAQLAISSDDEDSEPEEGGEPVDESEDEKENGDGGAEGDRKGKGKC